MELYHGFHAAQVALEQGLHSASLPDVLAAITNAPVYVDQMPFPMFVNAVLIKLAEAFQGEKLSPKLEQFVNLTRLRIVKAVQEFRRHVHVAFSSEEIVRRVMKVSHSNDYHARSLTLLFLAALAPLISENKKVHHLLIESLDCSEDTELSATIYAITEFGKHSSVFSSIIVEKISEVLCSSETSVEVKIRLLNVISNFKESYTVTNNCLALGEMLLKRNFDVKMHLAIYDSTTVLASRSSLAIPQQINLLLESLKTCIGSNKRISLCLLKNLNRLAKSPQQWAAAQVLRLRDFHDELREMGSIKALCTWLDCLEKLTSSGLHCCLITDNDLTWMELLNSPNLNLRLSSILLLKNLMSKTSTEYLQAMLLSAIADTVKDIHNSQSLKLKTKFCKFIISFCKMSQCSQLSALSIVSHLMKNCPCLTDPLISLYLQTLCAICDVHLECSAVVSSWALNQYLQAPNYDQVFPLALFDLMLTVPQAKQKDLCKLVDSLIASSKIQWTIYEVARTAFRYGHWKRVALPLLEFIKDGCESLETTSWINALVHMAKAQLDEVTVENLAESCSHLRKSTVLLQCLSATPRKEKCFSFASVFTQTLSKNWNTAQLIVSTLNVKILTLAGYEGTPFRNTQILNSLTFLQASVASVQKEWTSLYHHCFDSDPQTLQQIHLFIQFNALLNNLFLFLQNREIRPLQLNAEKFEGTMNNKLLNYLLAANNQLNEMVNDYSAMDVTSRLTTKLRRMRVKNHLHIRHIMLYHFEKRWRAAQSFRDIVELFGEEAISQSQVERWFKRFKSGDTSLQDEKGRGRPSDFNDQALKSFHLTLTDRLFAKEFDNIAKRLRCPPSFLEVVEHDMANVKNLISIKEMVCQLLSFPVGIPRSFFQRVYHTIIRLIVSPQPKEHESSFTITTNLLPLTVEGVVDSDNPKKIESVTVEAEVIYPQASHKASYEQRRVISLQESGKYFKAQFLLQINETAKINVKLLFTDSTTKRNWIDESATAAMNVICNFGHSVVQ